MTASALLGLITAALLMQLMVGIGVAVWRRRSAAVGVGEAAAIASVQMPLGQDGETFASRSADLRMRRSRSARSTLSR